MNNTPDYKNNLAFAPGDWSDSRVTGNTDRTASTIQLIEKIEQLEKENQKLKELLKECRTCVTRQIYGSTTKQYWEGVFDDELLTKIDEVLK